MKKKCIGSLFFIFIILLFQNNFFPALDVDNISFVPQYDNDKEDYFFPEYNQRNNNASIYQQRFSDKRDKVPVNYNQVNPGIDAFFGHSIATGKVIASSYDNKHEPIKKDMSFFDKEGEVGNKDPFSVSDPLLDFFDTSKTNHENFFESNKQHNNKSLMDRFNNPVYFADESSVKKNNINNDSRFTNQELDNLLELKTIDLINQLANNTQSKANSETASIDNTEEREQKEALNEIKNQSIRELAYDNNMIDMSSLKTLPSKDQDVFVKSIDQLIRSSVQAGNSSQKAVVQAMQSPVIREMMGKLTPEQRSNVIQGVGNFATLSEKQHKVASKRSAGKMAAPGLSFKDYVTSANTVADYRNENNISVDSNIKNISSSMSETDQKNNVSKIEEKAKNFAQQLLGKRTAKKYRLKISGKMTKQQWALALKTLSLLKQRKSRRPQSLRLNNNKVIGIEKKR